MKDQTTFDLSEVQAIALQTVTAVVDETCEVMRRNPDFLPESAIVRAAANVRDRIHKGEL